MNYAALEALEDQAELVREYGNYAAGKPSSVIPSFPRDTARAASDAVKRSSPCFVSKSIQEMLEHAMPTLPDTIPLRLEDVPFDFGFVKLATPVRIEATISHEGNGEIITHFAWRRDPLHVTAFWFGYSIRERETARLLQYLTATTWMYGRPLDDDALIREFFDGFEGKETLGVRTRIGNRIIDSQEDREMLAVGTYLQHVRLLRWAYSVWYFMQQRVSTKERAFPDRAMRKRLNLEKEQKFVDIITLRASEKQKEDANREEASRHVGVRFWVRAHWRKQWYPSEGVNKPLWISSYVKGPDGAKFVGPTKLFSMSR